MTETIEVLLATIEEDPEDRTAWLVLADALAEADRDDEADLIRSGANVRIHEDAVIDSDARKYEYREESGYSEEMDADDMDEAIEMAEELARGGEYGDEGASVSVWVTEYDATGEETDRRSLSVDIEPNHESLIRAATQHDSGRSCGDSPDDHDWTSQGEGGCDENPGVWSTGGTSMLFASHCRICGLHRREHWCGSQRNPGEHDTTEYEMPPSWCADCESEECKCETNND